VPVRLAAAVRSALRVSKEKEERMARVTYHIVEHDGGWAYRVGDVFSETFPSRDLAVKVAERAASEQRVAGDTTGITWEDRDGHWRDELSEGGDRPDTDVDK
jgi:Uncharacterized protein conserved in bacteria (DUF2188)